MRLRTMLMLGGATAVAALSLGPATAQQDGYNPATMTFFVTSAGMGDGGNLGGLEGADAHCQALATAAGAGDRTWVAYLSTDGEGGVNAGERVGEGPWVNATGVTIAASLAELHGTNAIDKTTALTELGMVVNGRGDTPNIHDILTGTLPEGTAAAGATCGNWTLATADAVAMVGHHDLVGHPTTNFWNSSHESQSCSQAGVERYGGAGLFYCFAVTP